MSYQPAISVVLPVYNAEKYVRDAVESLIAQSVNDFEIIVVDDGSTDRSTEILKSLATQDTRLCLHHQPNGGIVSALNTGLADVRGQFVARMDADDIALPHRFERQLEFLRAHPQHVAVGSAVLQVDPDGDPIRVQRWAQSHEEIDAQLLHGGGGLAHPTAMIRAKAMRQVGGYRLKYQWVEDKDLWLRLAEIGELANLAEPLLKYRLHRGSMTSQRAAEQYQLLNRLLIETYARRGITEAPPPVTFKHRAFKESRSKWIRAATRHGNFRTAIKHLLYR